LLFIGAGGVNFGGHGNAWDHATRLEKLENITVVGIADVFTDKANEVLAKRQLKKHTNIWKNTKIFSDYREMIKEAQPDAIIIGLPPNCHGSMEKPVELDCVKAGIHVLLEKPISCTPPEDMELLHQGIVEAESKGVIVSVAYMFRYSKVILKMKELIAEFGEPRYFNARYNCAYSMIGNDTWWDNSRSGGPIVEQATHFVDLARFLCGEVKEGSIKVTSVSPTEPIGALSKITIDEKKIPEPNRTNRVTSAMWKFENGAVGNLTHTVLLHGWRYELQLEVFGDGYYVYIHNPYDECRITVRRPGSEQEEITTLPDDPYLHEVETFIEAVRTSDKSKVCSSYADAFKTYKMTWDIRRASQQT